MCNRCTLSVTENKLLAVFSGGSERSRVRKFQGAKVPHLELSLPGANGLGSEKSSSRKSYEIATTTKSYKLIEVDQHHG